MSFRLRVTKADKLFSLLVRTLADWCCERCGGRYEPPTASLQCSHFHSRAKRSVRFDRENAAALCVGCHMFFTGNPEEHRKFFVKRLGQARYDRLTVRANTPQRVDEHAIATALTLELAEMQAKRRETKVI